MTIGDFMKKARITIDVEFNEENTYSKEELIEAFQPENILTGLDLEGVETIESTVEDE